MPVLASWSLLALSGLLGAVGSAKTKLSVLVAVLFLVPGRARPPGVIGGEITMHRIVLLAVLVGLLRELWSGSLDPRRFAVRGVHVGLAIFLSTVVLVGYAYADASVPARANLSGFLLQAEHAVFFVVFLALVREIGVMWSASAVVVGATVAAVVGLAERAFTWSYTHWFIEPLFDPEGVMSSAIQYRGGEIRVRVAALFALEFGWIMALLVPLTLGVAVARGRLIWWAPPALLSAAMVFTWSRSAYLGLATGCGVWVIGLIWRRPRSMPVVAVVGLVAVAAVVPQFSGALDAGSTSGDADVRFERLPELSALVSDDPLTGLGLGGDQSEGVQLVDISWMRLYVTLGVAGLVAMSVLLVTMIATGLSLIRAPRAPSRLVGIGAGAALAALPTALLSYDVHVLAMSMQAMFVLAALAVASGEELGVLPVPMRTPGRRQITLVAAAGLLGAVLGVGIAAASPVHRTATVVFGTLDPRFSAEVNLQYNDEVLGQSVCDTLSVIELDVDVACRPLEIPGGLGEIRLESRHRDDVTAAVELLDQRMSGLFDDWTIHAVSEGSGRRASATTAPLWVASVFTTAAFFGVRWWRVVAAWRSASRRGREVAVGAHPDRRAHHQTPQQAREPHEVEHHAEGLQRS